MAAHTSRDVYGRWLTFSMEYHREYWLWCGVCVRASEDLVVAIGKHILLLQLFADTEFWIVESRRQVPIQIRRRRLGYAVSGQEVSVKLFMQIAGIITSWICQYLCLGQFCQDTKQCVIKSEKEWFWNTIRLCKPWVLCRAAWSWCPWFSSGTITEFVQDSHCHLWALRPRN